MLIVLKKIYKRLFPWPNLIKQVQKTAIFDALRLDDSCILCDVGCAGGEFDEYVKKRMPSVQIIAGDLHQRQQWQSYDSDVMYLTMSGLQLPFADKSADRILFGEIISLVADSHLFLQEAARVLKDDGQIVIVNGKGYRTIQSFYSSWWLKWLRALAVRLTRLPDSYGSFMRQHIQNTNLDDDTFARMFTDVEQFVKSAVARTDLQLVAESYSFNRGNEFLLACLMLVRKALGMGRPRLNYFLLYPLALIIERLPVFNRNGLGFIYVLKKT